GSEVRCPAQGQPEKRLERLTERRHATHTTVVRVGEVAIGGGVPVVVAGPCSVELQGRFLAAAMGVKARGATLWRGGAYEPRTSPYDFRGLSRVARLFLGEVSERT